MGEVRVCQEPTWEDPDSGRVAWYLEWSDSWSVRRRLLYGYGPGARRAAEAQVDRLAGGAGAVEFDELVEVLPPAGEGESPGGES